MAYKDKFGCTSLRSGRRDNLSIGWDNFVNSAKNFAKDQFKKNRIPVFLFTPDMDNTVNHYHIMLSRGEAKKLRDWLDAYLKDV